MPVGGGSGGGSKTENRIYLKPRGFKENEELKIHMTKWDSEKRQQEDMGAVQWVTAYLEKIEKGSYEWNGDTYDTLTIDLVEEDGDDGLPTRYILQMSFGGAARDIINRLCYVAEHLSDQGKIREMVTIGVYEMNGKDDDGNDRVYKGAFVKYGSNSYDIKKSAKAEKNWPYEKLKSRIKTIEANRKKINDYTELDAFFAACIENIINPAIEPDYSIPVTTESSGVDSHAGNDILPEAGPIGDHENEDEDDDLPF